MSEVIANMLSLYVQKDSQRKLPTCAKPNCSDTYITFFAQHLPWACMHTEHGLILISH